MSSLKDEALALQSKRKALSCNLFILLDARCGTASYEITFVLLFVCLSVRPSLSFLKIISLVFSDIAHNYSWPWYLVTGEARILKKKIEGPNLGKWTKIGSEARVFFCHFLNFGSLVFFEIAYSDSLQ